jgi:Na+/melibiose symporter-like transporter
MGLAMLVSLALSLLLSIPLITAAFARRMGRPWKMWFLIGLLLPVIAIILLFFLPDLSERKEQTKM